MRHGLLPLVLCMFIGCGGERSAADVDQGPGRDIGPTDMGSPTDMGATDMRGGEVPDAGGGESDAGLADMSTVDASPDADLAPSCPPVFSTVLQPGDPPFSGTAYVTNELITDQDPSAFVDLTYAGQADRLMFDRRPAAFVTVNAHLFDATFGTNTSVEIQVNPEFSQADAETHARRYAAVIGQLPAFMFAELETVWIHDGDEDFGGGNNNLLIHTQRGDAYAAMGSLEEIFLHEGTHTSIDPTYADDPQWQAAAQADGTALSTYARDNPQREDLAETLGPYLAVRFRPERVSDDVLRQITDTIPNRIAFFDCQSLSMELVR